MGASVNSSFRVVTIEIDTVPQLFEAGVCPSGTDNVLLLGFLILLTVSLLAIGIFTGIPFLTLFAGLLLLPLPFILAACSSFMALIIGGLAGVIILFAAIEAFNTGTGMSR